MAFSKNILYANKTMLMIFSANLYKGMVKNGFSWIRASKYLIIIELDRICGLWMKENMVLNFDLLSPI